MIQRQLKLRLTKIQEAKLNEWLWILTGVHNWAIRKIKLDAADGRYYTKMSFQNGLADHGQKVGVPSHVLQGVLRNAHGAWNKCFKKIAKEPRLKGGRNKLNSIPFIDPIAQPKKSRISLPGL